MTFKSFCPAPLLIVPHATPLAVVLDITSRAKPFQETRYKVHEICDSETEMGNNQTRSS